MSDNNIENNGTEETGTEKTFTQAELEHIIGERLAREKAKYADYDALRKKAEAWDEAEEKNKSELEKAVERADKAEAELSALRKQAEVSKLKTTIGKEFGIDPTVLRGNNEEELKAHAESIKSMLSSLNSYPIVHDKGETPAPTITKEEILKIKDDKARRKAIRENISLWQ